MLKTMGIVVVAAWAASAAGVLPGVATTDQIGRHSRQSIVLAVRPAIFDRHVLSIDIPHLAQALAEGEQTARPGVRRCAAEEPDHRHRRLLRARRERPRGCRAAEQRNELTPPHVGHGGFLPPRSEPSATDGPLRSVYGTLNLLQSSRQVLGADLNRSESRGRRPAPQVPQMSR
jgi:hypothetical protein